MIPNAPCELPDPCCTDLYSIAAHLLAAVFDALSECCGGGGCEDLAAYVTLGNGDDGVKDALTVQFSSLDPSVNTRPGGLGLYRATFQIILRESGWPTARVEGDTIVLPQPSEQAAAAQYIYARGEAIHRKLAYMQATKTLAPSNAVCVMAVVGQLTPLNPLGGVAGWSVPVVVDLPWN